MAKRVLGVGAHPDHLAASRAALDARLTTKMPLYYHELCEEGISVWAIPELWLFNPGSPNHYVDVTNTIDVQLRALARHKSQASVWDEAARSFIEKRAEEAGKQIGVKYAEAFRRIMTERALIGAGTTL